MPKDKETLTVVVNGSPTEVPVNDQAPLRTVIPKALQQTGNTGQPPDNWELKLADGTVLLLDKKIGEYGFEESVVLFLSLKAGAGG